VNFPHVYLFYILNILKKPKKYFFIHSMTPLSMREAPRARGTGSSSAGSAL